MDSKGVRQYGANTLTATMTIPTQWGNAINARLKKNNNMTAGDGTGDVTTLNDCTVPYFFLKFKIKELERGRLCV